MDLSDAVISIGQDDFWTKYLLNIKNCSRSKELFWYANLASVSFSMFENPEQTAFRQNKPKGVLSWTNIWDKCLWANNNLVVLYHGMMSVTVWSNLVFRVKITEMLKRMKNLCRRDFLWKCLQTAEPIEEESRRRRKTGADDDLKEPVSHSFTGI